MACTQKEIKDFPWTIPRAAALFREARTDFVEQGVTDFNKIVDGLSARHGLKREIIVKGLSEPRGVSRNLTDEMWVKQQAARRISSAAKTAVQELLQNKFSKGLKFAAEAPRRIILAGHFGAFTKSHLSDQLFYNPETYGRNFKDSWSLATKRGIAQHEQRLLSEFNPTDPEVKLALRAGLNVGEGGAGRFAKETSEVTGTGKLLGKVTDKLQNVPGFKATAEFLKPDRASMAFDELRISRMRIFRKELARLSPEERGDIEQVKALASVINHDTGTTASGSRTMRFIFMSPRLLPAQAAHTFIDIPKALVQTGMGVNYAKAAPAMRYVARKTAILAGAYTGALAANAGIGLATGDKRFMPNFGQEGAGKASFLRPKLFGYSVPVSPTVELLKLPVQMIAAGASARKGDSKSLVALTRGLQTVMGRQNPLFSVVEESLFGQNIVTGRPTPFPGVTGKTEPTKNRPRMGWIEYAGTKMPIPAANYLREFYDESVSHGMPPKDALEWVKYLGKSAIAPTIELGTSYHLSPVKEYPKAISLPKVQ